MRWLVTIALVACSPARHSADDDASADAGMPEDDGGYVEMRCDAPTTFAEGLSPSRVLHVEAGAASGGDGSVAAPFATIEAAAAAATPGTFIQLGAGVHDADQYVDSLRGTAQAPIWIGGSGMGAKPVIEGGAQALQLTKPAYVVVQHLEVRGASGNGINIDDGADYANDTAAHHVAVLDVDIHDIGGTGNQDCLKVSGVNDLAVYDSRFARCGGAASGSGIDHVGCHRSVIARNVFDAMSGNAMQAKGGSTDIDFRQNRVRDGGDRVVNLGGSTGLEFFRPPLSTTAPNAEARRVRVFNNLITGTTGAPFAFVGCVDCLVAHNAVVGDPRWLVRILQETTTQSGYTFEPAKSGRVINNSFVWKSTALSTHVNVGANTDAASFTFSHNLWLAYDDPTASTPSLPVTEVGSVIGVGSAYSAVLYMPAEYLVHTICWTDGEAFKGVALPEVDGTLFGDCRVDFDVIDLSIGPLTATSCTL
jgi:hypothetical protein